MDSKSVSLFIEISIEILKIVKKSVDKLDVKFVEDMNVLMPVCREIMTGTEAHTLPEETLIQLISAIELIYNDSFISRYKYKRIIGMINEFNSLIN